jgi:hypothetical protein
MKPTIANIAGMVLPSGRRKSRVRAIPENEKLHIMKDFHEQPLGASVTPGPHVYTQRPFRAH